MESYRFGRETNSNVSSTTFTFRLGLGYESASYMDKLKYKWSKIKKSISEFRKNFLKKSRIPLFSSVTKECNIFTLIRISKHLYYVPELRLISRYPLYYDWVDRDFSKPKDGNILYKCYENRYLKWYQI